MSKSILLSLIAIFSIVIIIEVFYLYGKDVFSDKLSQSSKPTSAQAPSPDPLKENRQSISIKETGGLDQASAQLSYKGVVTSMNIGQTASIALDVQDTEKDPILVFENSMIKKITISEGSNTPTNINNLSEISKLFKIGDALTAKYNFDLKTNNMIAISLSKL